MNPRRVLLVVCLAATVSVLIPARASQPLGDQLGTVRFEVSGKPEAQAHVVRGVKLLHHMMYAEAGREFAQAAALDPGCALAWWGRAMAIIHPLWPDAPTDADRAAGAEFIRRGLASPPATPRERDYLEVLNLYFGAPDGSGYPAKLKALDDAWTAVADRYPEDLDALAFSALYHLAPARFLPKDRSHRLQLSAASRLTEILTKIPDHPGAQHYKIHAYDFPLLADRALEVCDTYGSIAPDVPHALHMPTHIFTRRGLWDKSIEFNRRSAEAARKLGLNAGALNGHYPHALDYMVYAYLQRAKYGEAEAVRRSLATMTGPYADIQPGAMAFAFAAIPARCALERQAWAEAARLPLHQPVEFQWGKGFLHCDSIVRYARAVGAARSGQLAAARAEIAELEAIHRELVARRGVVYWVTQAEVQARGARAWVELAEGNTEGALAMMRRAVDLELTTDKEAITPGEVLPAGDLLGDMLLEAGRPAEALAAFEAVLAASPNRLNSLYGAGFAAEQAGDAAKARSYYAQVLEVAAGGDPGIARVERARQYLAEKRLAGGGKVR